MSFALYVICTILAGFGAWVVSKFAYKYSLMDIPCNRSSHKTPIPKSGGVGILVSFVVSSLVLKIPLGFWLPAVLLALISFYGDKFELSPKFRLIVQFTAALFFLSTTYSFQFALRSLLLLVPLLLFLTVFIVGTANYYNFMDGINGIAGITGVVGFGLLVFYAFTSGSDSSFMSLSICMSLSCLGFLPFNAPKAKVFMGDVGSVLLGFVFAGMVVWFSSNILDFMCLASFLFPFYADELTTMVIRIQDGEKLTRPHRRHLYQLLVNEFGIAHWKVSMAYGITQLLIGSSILAVRSLGGGAVLSLLIVYFAGFIILTRIARTKLHRMKT